MSARNQAASGVEGLLDQPALRVNFNSTAEMIYVIDPTGLDGVNPAVVGIDIKFWPAVVRLVNRRLRERRARLRPDAP